MEELRRVNGLNEDICYLLQNNQDNHSDTGPRSYHQLQQRNVASLLLPKMKHALEVVEVELVLVRQCLEEEVLYLTRPRRF